MKRVLLLAVSAVAASQLGVAASCSSGSLASYIALGSSGCTIGGDTLSNFKLLTGSTGATPIVTSLVTLNPTGGTLNPVLTISTNQTATTNSLETIFTYSISGSSFTGISAVLGNSSESGTGDVTGLVNFCEGSSFGPDGVTGCAGANGGLTTLDGIQNTDMATFGKVPFLNVTNDLEFDGPATGGTLTNSFTAVPEPMPTALAGFGLLFVGAMRVRCLRAKQESK